MVGIRAASVLLVLLAPLASACKGDGKATGRPRDLYHPLAACGITYDASEWDVTDPAPIIGSWLPRIEPLEWSSTARFREARARFTRGEDVVEITCSAWWSPQARLTLGAEAVSAETFEEFVAETQRRRVADVLTVSHEEEELDLAGGATLPVTIVVTGRGLIEKDQRRQVTGFGGLDAGDKHVAIGFSGFEDDLDLDAVRALLAGVSLP